jgi:hypothetical protein
MLIADQIVDMKLEFYGQGIPRKGIAAGLLFFKDWLVFVLPG